MSMRYEPYPVKRCVVCAMPFNSRPNTRRNGDVVWSIHCSWDCAMVTVHRKAKGRPMAKALAARSAKMAARYAAKLRAEFGVLSDREVALMKRAEKRGYDRGYQIAYCALKPRKKDTAA